MICEPFCSAVDRGPTARSRTDRRRGQSRSGKDDDKEVAADSVYDRSLRQTDVYPGQVEGADAAASELSAGEPGSETIGILSYPEKGWFFYQVSGSIFSGF